MNIKYKSAVITISDKGYKNERLDLSGPNLINLLKSIGIETIYSNVIPDDIKYIKDELIKCSDELKVSLILTTGGTGLSKNDVTPDATKEVINREITGIPEIMRIKSYEITKNACLSREIAGIRNDTLIINLPGSKKGSEENFLFIKDILIHALDTINSTESLNCGG